jgi:ankyrin repeat protein
LLAQWPQDEKRREVVKLLLEYGAEVNPKRGNNRSLLVAPVSRDMVDLVKFLLEVGIDPRKDADGGAAVSREAELHGSPAMKSLIQGALSKSPDPYGASKLW